MKKPKRQAKPTRGEAIEPELLEPEKPKMGRPSSYTEEKAAAICQRMVMGQGLLRICADPDMPERTTVYKWLDAQPAFVNKYARAREALMDYYAEQVLAISFDESGDILIDQDDKGKTKLVANHAKVQRDRLKVDSLKWTASRLFPKRYGDKMELLAQNDADDGKTVQFQWIEHGPSSAPPAQPEPPRLLPPKATESRPGDLSDADWQLLSEMLSLARRALQGKTAPPATVFSGMISFLQRYLDGE